MTTLKSDLDITLMDRNAASSEPALMLAQRGREFAGGLAEDDDEKLDLILTLALVSARADAEGLSGLRTHLFGD